MINKHTYKRPHRWWGRRRLLFVTPALLHNVLQLNQGPKGIMAMTYLWLLLGFVAMWLISTVMSICWGRGHLGAEQTESHYLDEVEAMAHTPYI